MSDERDIEIGEAVLAALPLPADAAGRRLAERWDDTLGPLAAALPPVPPAPQLWRAVARRIDSEVVGSDGAVTVRADALPWEAISPGVDRKRLYESRLHGRCATLFRIAPGAAIAAHDHPGLEECLVLEGEIEFAGVVVRAGDFHVADAAARHVEIRAPRGALLYIAAPLAA